jgi:hypothetical protein
VLLKAVTLQPELTSLAESSFIWVAKKSCGIQFPGVLHSPHAELSKPALNLPKGVRSLTT